MHNGERLYTLIRPEDPAVDAHAQARTRFVLEYSRPSNERLTSARFRSVVRSTSVESLFS